MECPMIHHTVELKCCRRPWGTYSKPGEAMREVESLIRCHEAYYKTRNPLNYWHGMKQKKHKTVVEVICKPVTTWEELQ